MPTQNFLDQLGYAATQLPPTDTLRMVLDELLALHATGVVSYYENPGASNATGLFTGGVQTGAYMQFKEHDVPSFIHELTHCACLMGYDADMLNYTPGGVNNVARQFTNGPPPGESVGTVTLTNSILRRQSWYKAHCKTFLDTNLNNLGAWVDVTDFTPPAPFMSAAQKAEMKGLATPTTVQEMNRKAQLDRDALSTGQVQKSGKTFGAKKVNERRLQAENDRKKDWVRGRVNYGLNGMGGMGDSHFEYDTVINQMLYQMYLWGFRKSPPRQFTMIQLAALVDDDAVPGEFLYENIAVLALEAHQRRVAAGGIANGAPPTIVAPAVLINPPG